MIAAESSEPGIGRVFSLNPEPDYRRSRPFRLMALAFVGLLSIWLTVFVVRIFESSLPGGFEAAIVGGTVLPRGMAVAIWGTLRLGRGADSCRMTADDLTLVYRSGRLTKFSWNNPFSDSQSLNSSLEAD